MSLRDVCEFLTVRETAQILQCHPDTVAAMIRRGELKVVRLGRAVRVVSEFDPRSYEQSSSDKSRQRGAVMNAPIMTDAEKLREIYAKQNGLPYPGPAPSAEPTLNYSDLSENEDLGEPESENPWMHSAVSYVVNGKAVHAFPCKRGGKDPVS